MAGIDLSHLKKVNVDAEEPTTSINTSPSNIPVGSPMPITHNQPQNSSSELANMISGGFNVGTKAINVGASFAKKSFKPLMILTALDLIKTGIAVYQNVTADKQLTKRYEAWTKMQTDNFKVQKQTELEEVRESERSKRFKIQKDSEDRQLELYKKLKEMEDKYQKADKDLELQKNDMEHMYQTIDSVLDEVVESHKASRIAYFASNCNNAELKERLERDDEQINNFMKWYLQIKAGVRGE